METFTLFIIVPSEEVCSLRNLPSGVSVREVRARLELMAGLPGQTYRLSRSEGQGLHEDHALVLGQTVWDGCVLRVELWECWEPLYNAVLRCDAGWVLRNGAVCPPKENVDPENLSGKSVEILKERGTVALYLAAWHNAIKVCQGLLSCGVDPNGRTPFGRSALFAVAFKNHVTVLESLLTHGARLNVKDARGDTPLDVAKRNFSRQVISRIRSFQLTTRFSSSASSSSPTRSSPTRSSPSRSIATATSSQLVYAPNDSRTPSTSLNASKIPTPRSSMQTTSSFYVPSNSRPTPSLCSTPRDNADSTASQNARASSDKSFGVRYRVAVFPHRPPSEARSDQDSGPYPKPPRGKSPSGGKRSVTPSSGNGRSSAFVSWCEPLTSQPSLQVSNANQQSRYHVFSGSGGASVLTPEPWFHTRYGGDGESPGRPPSVSSHRTGESIVSAPCRQDMTSESSHHVMDARSVDSAPDLDGGRVTSRSRQSPRLLRSRQKQSESWRTARRRIQLAEQQKRQTTVSRTDRPRETFEQWLDRKRKEERRNESSGDETSADSEDEESGSQAFQNWLKELRQRQIDQPNPKSAVHLHKKKTRAIKGLISIGETKDTMATPLPPPPPPEPDTYMEAMSEWKDKRKHSASRSGKLLSGGQAKRQLETKRQQLLAMAITYDEWMDHTEERKLLMKTILEADQNKLDELERTQFHKGSKQMSFRAWKERLLQKEAKSKKAEDKNRRKVGEAKVNQDVYGVTSGLSQSQWKRHDNSLQQAPMERPKSALRKPKFDGEDESDMRNKRTVAFQTWTKNKQQAELAAVNARIYRESRRVPIQV